MQLDWFVVNFHSIVDFDSMMYMDHNHMAEPLLDDNKNTLLFRCRLQIDLFYDRVVSYSHYRIRNIFHL